MKRDNVKIKVYSKQTREPAKLCKSCIHHKMINTDRLRCAKGHTSRAYRPKNGGNKENPALWTWKRCCSDFSPID